MKAVFIYLFFIVALLPAQEFREIERWEHDNPFFGQIMFSYVDDSGNLILDINNTRSRLINKNHSGQFLEVGEGPDELTGLLAIADFGPKQIALLERRDRIKIFTLVDGSYRFKEMKWLKRNEKPFFINAMLWEKDKIIMGGYETLETQKQLETAAYLKILRCAGELLFKQLN